MDRRLIQFLAVAEAGNVSRAAETLKVSQPTISVNLRRLEDDHGVALFERSSRGVVLTKFGRVLHDHVRAMKRLEDNARAEILALRSDKDHGLRVGCGYAWWQFPLRHALDGFQRDMPGRSVLVDVSSSLDGVRKVLAGDVAMFLGTQVKNLKPELAVQFRPLFKALHGYFARQAHPLAARPCTYEDLARYPRMDVVPVETSHLAIVDPQRETAPEAAGVPPFVLSTNSMTVCQDMLRDSDAVLGYPRALEGYFTGQAIVPLTVKGRDMWETIGIYHLEDRGSTRAFRDFVGRILDALDECRSADRYIEALGAEFSASAALSP